MRFTLAEFFLFNKLYSISNHKRGSHCNVQRSRPAERRRTERRKVSLQRLEKMEEPDPGFEECSTKRRNPGLCLEPEGLLNRERNPSGNSEAESSGLEPAYPVCVPRCRWEERGGGEASPSSMSEYWLYSDNQHDMADCHVAGTIITPPATPVTHRPGLFIPAPSSVTDAASALSSVVTSVVCSPVTDTCGPISSMCSPTSSAWDTLGSTSRSPGCSEGDPVSAAAHLHLLGESLSLIGHHLQETSKTVSMSSSLSLLLDSLLCALAPLIGLTAQIPELRSCTQHTLPSTLENISFLMPGL